MRTCSVVVTASSSLLGLPSLRRGTFRRVVTKRVRFHHRKDQCEFLQLLVVALSEQAAAARASRPESTEPRAGTRAAARLVHANVTVLP